MIAEAAARLMQSPGLGREELARLQGSRVGLIGLGLLGGQLSGHLGLVGVGQQLVDCDVIAPSNLGSQGFPFDSVGQAKAVVRARQIKSLNPDCHVQPTTARIEDLGLAVFAGVDALATGLDGRGSRVRVAQISSALGIPWVDAAVDGRGRSLHGTVTVYDPRVGTHPTCYGCRFDSADFGIIAGEGRGPGCGSWRNAGRVITPPTLQASAFGGVVAGLAAIAVMRVLLDRAADLIGRQVLIAADTIPSTRLVALSANPRCLLGHQRLSPLRHAAGRTVGDLLSVAAADLGSAAVELRFHGRAVVLGLVCGRCRARRDLVRVAEAYTDAEIRCDCAPGSEMTPVAVSDSLDANEARRCADLSWRDLGLPAADVVTARSGGREMHFIVNRGGAADGQDGRSEFATAAG